MSNIEKILKYFDNFNTYADKKRHVTDIILKYNKEFPILDPIVKNIKKNMLPISNTSSISDYAIIEYYKYPFIIKSSGISPKEKQKIVDDIISSIITQNVGDMFVYSWRRSTSNTFLQFEEFYPWTLEKWILNHEVFKENELHRLVVIILKILIGLIILRDHNLIHNDLHINNIVCTYANNLNGYSRYISTNHNFDIILPNNKMLVSIIDFGRSVTYPCEFFNFDNILIQYFQEIYIDNISDNKNSIPNENIYCVDLWLLLKGLSASFHKMPNGPVGFLSDLNEIFQRYLSLCEEGILNIFNTNSKYIISQKHYMYMIISLIDEIYLEYTNYHAKILQFDNDMIEFDDKKIDTFNI